MWLHACGGTIFKLFLVYIGRVLFWSCLLVLLTCSCDFFSLVDMQLWKSEWADGPERQDIAILNWILCLVILGQDFSLTLFSPVRWLLSKGNTNLPHRIALFSSTCSPCNFSDISSPVQLTLICRPARLNADCIVILGHPLSIQVALVMSSIPFTQMLKPEAFLSTLLSLNNPLLTSNQSPSSGHLSYYLQIRPLLSIPNSIQLI